MDPRSEKPLVVSFPVEFVGRRNDEVVISINTKTFLKDINFVFITKFKFIIFLNLERLNYI